MSGSAGSSGSARDQQPAEVRKKRARNKTPTGCLAASASSTLLRPILTILLAVVRLKVEALIAFAHAESVYIHNPTSVLQTKKYRKESGPTG